MSQCGIRSLLYEERSAHVPCFRGNTAVNALTARVMISAIQMWHYTRIGTILKRFINCMMDFAKIALFKSYAVIYLTIGMAIIFI